MENKNPIGINNRNYSYNKSGSLATSFIMFEILALEALSLLHYR